MVEEIASIVGKKKGVDFVTENVAGIRILDIIAGYDKLVIVDAVEKGGKPGELHNISLKELNETVHLTSIHSINFATAIELGKKMGLKIPESISIYGIEIKEVFKFSERMTPEVECSIKSNAVEIIERELGVRSQHLT